MLEDLKRLIDPVTLKLVEDGPYYHRSALGHARRAATPTGPCHRHDPRPKDPGSITEETFTQARRLPRRFWVTLVVPLTERRPARHDARTRFRGPRPLSLDGT